ncbi:cobalamin-dependent protein [Bacilliculturomica massiliensis]|uniref:cobalamin-dependent protein n=1 Tax=Bacilliculturomica massiliensis TaxID=1917867 RepID=UPI0010318754|nr:cobalamin-dependent protein [Bacilliculturomica massiliensis]
MEIKMKKRFEYKNLPDMQTIRSEIKKLQDQVELGQTLFCKEHGVKTEGEYKKKMMNSGHRHIMKHTHIGYNTWDTTKKCVEEVYSQLQERGSYIDRFGFCLDNLMGMPEKWRAGQLQGTGLIFKNEEEWKQIGQIVPVQPHCGDMMIGTLNGLENAMNALRAGVTTIGNPSHYYTYEWPGIDEEEYRVMDIIKAVGVMAKFKEDGAIIHSNLDDGYGGQLHDIANLVGWARVERYYIEDLLGGGLGHCFGNLFSHPIMRIIFNLAVWEMNPNHIPGSMIYGNTTEYGFDFEQNCGALASFITGDIIGQNRLATGHAVVPIPVSEAARIPTVEEIVQAHMIADKMIKKAPCYAEYLDWDKIIAEKDLLVACGNLFFERVMNGLDSLGVDTEHPGEIMGAIKAIGPAQLEENFGVGKADKMALRGRIPVRPTNSVSDLKRQEHSIIVQIPGLEKSLEGVKVVICTTDVHEFGKQIIKDILIEAGATVFDLGTSIGTAEVLDAVIETECKVVLVSTYNGIAYSYGKELLEGLEKRKLDGVSVIMGGLLNEDLDGDELAEDVSDKLKEMGIHADNKAEEIIDVIKACL